MANTAGRKFGPSIKSLKLLDFITPQQAQSHRHSVRTPRNPCDALIHPNPYLTVPNRPSALSEACIETLGKFKCVTPTRRVSNFRPGSVETYGNAQ
jgi:hypothetical protein